MILITGANGHLGSATIDFLLEKTPDSNIAGLVRSEEKGAELKKKGVEIRIGDYFDTASLDEAMKGINTLLLISTSTMEDRVKQHENVIKAAKKAGVKHVYYTSMLQVEKGLSPLNPVHHETEKIIKSSELSYTIHRHTFYTEFFPMFLGDALETGNWKFPSNSQKANFALRTEMAEALANGLSEPGNHKNKIYEITSAKAYTFEEYASILSEATGKDITYTDVSVETFVEGLKNAGLPDETIAMSQISAATVANGALVHTSDDLETLLGRKPTNTAEFIKEFVKE